jgi:SAM-dependent methyltransferase
MSTSPLSMSPPWDLVASGYEDVVLPQLEQFAREALRRVPPSGKVLDVGTGPGTLSLLAAAAGAQVTAVDFAPEMVARARRRAEAAKLDVDLRVGDATQLDVPDARFDAAYAMFVLMFVPDRPAAFRELARVLRPGGRALVASWPPMNRVRAWSAPFDALRKHVPTLPPNDGTAILGTLADLREAFAGSSFADVHAAEITMDFEAPSSDAMWAAMVRSTAPILMLSKRLGAQWPAIEASVRDELRRELGPGAIQFTMVANFGWGTRA